MSRLAPFAQLILESVQHYHVRHAIAGYYDVEHLIKWFGTKHKDELKKLYAAYKDCPDPKRAVQVEIEEYLPALNQKKLSTRPIEPKGCIILWRVAARTAPPAEAPVPVAKVPEAPPAKPGKQPWIALIDNGDLAGLRKWLDGGGDANAPGKKDGESPLDHAASAGEVAMVQLLIERGAKGKMPLLEAVLNFRGAAARVLLEHNPSLDDLKQARATVRDLVDDPELFQLIEAELRRRKRKK